MRTKRLAVATALVPVWIMVAVVSGGGAAGASGLGGPPPIVPNDPLFLNVAECQGIQNCVNQQWNLMSDGRGISADTAWNRTKGAGVIVAMVDTGINPDQPDLAPRLDPNHPGYDFYQGDTDPSDGAAYGHGTGTAGIAVGEQNNAIGISGVAPKATLMVVRTSDTILDQPEQLAQGIRYAADHGASVISMSLGSLGTSADLKDAVAYAQSKGAVLVAATANEFSMHPNTPTYLDGILAVGAIVPDSQGTGSDSAGDFTVKGGFSNYGPRTDLGAPSEVYTSKYDGTFGKGGGTSSATPHVAGTAALVFARALKVGLTLSSAEVRQILIMSADDLVGGPYGYAKGWDKYTGYGRVDAARAVAMVTPDGSKIPPVANITSPAWFQTVGGAVAVTGSVSARNGPYRWTLQVGQGVQPSSWRTLGTGSGTDPFDGTLGTFDPAGLRDGLYTLRLKASDGRGNGAEDRQAFTVLRDTTALPGFPKQLASSVESSPQFADLNGDGKDELIVADQSGLVYAFTDGGGELRGWPVKEQALPTPFDGRMRAGFVSSPAVADLFGNGQKDVIVGGLDGFVYAWGPDGTPLPGWPVPTKTPLGPDPNNQHWTSMIVSSPAVGELDGPSSGDSNGPEIVVGAGDGKVYAFHRDGTAVAGFPVLLQDSTQSPETAKVASSPAIGDIDGDGFNEIVIGDGETYGSDARVYAIRGDGSIQPGWPVSISAFAPDGTPIVGQGTPESPVLADVDGDGAMEIAIGSFTSRFHLLRGDGTEEPGGANSQGQFFSNTFGADKDPNVTAIGSRSTVGNFAFADLNGDGKPDLIAPSTDGNLFGASIYEGRVIPFQHLISAWSTTNGAYLPAFPRLVEDWMFLTAPIVADVNGDGTPEIVIGNGDGYVHAFSPDGSEPVGWPKYVGQWIQASAAAGDMNGDGLTDIAFVTRQGGGYVFSTGGYVSDLQWPNFHGNAADTGVFAG